ncbi:TFIIH subunit Tfb4/p34 [Limtongia smithiae]|uniref:TFIIH subunit Tfb4/p34 n=1 Tax=Limtongia smithiae TaxID=1125753 RepID=UPI0034CE2ADA
MNDVDGSSHVPQEKYQSELEDELPSLLTLIIDTSPVGWHNACVSAGAAHSGTSLQDVVAALMVFANCHLALNHSNEVAVIASHSSGVRFLYPPAPERTSMTTNISSSRGSSSNGNGHAKNIEDEDSPAAMPSPAAANGGSSMYRQFRRVNESVLTHIEALLLGTRAEDIEDADGHLRDTSHVSGALSVALAYINRLAGSSEDDDDAIIISGNENTKSASGGGRGGGAIDGDGERRGAKMKARIVVLSVCADLAAQYVPMMNCIFAAQKMKVPIDVCKIGTDATVFLQQAADTTGGVYMHLTHARGLIQYLMTAFMADSVLRRHLVLPTQSGVNFRAACFCHKRIVDVGYVCNVCFSIFCEPPADGSCAICDTIFDARELKELMRPPVVAIAGAAAGPARKKVKKKKRKEGES